MRAVVIHGRALFRARKALAFDEYNLPRLYQFVTDKRYTGTESLMYGCPIITLSPAQAGFARYLTRLGFKVVLLENGKDAKTGRFNDVQYLIEHMQKLDINKVSEIVLFGWDADLLDALLDKLEKIDKRYPKKKDQPLAWVLGTRASVKGEITIDDESWGLIETSDDYFDFVELSAYVPWLAQTPAPAANGHTNGAGDANDGGADAPEQQPAADEQPGDERLRIVFEMKDGAPMTTDLITELLALQRQHPDALARVE